MNGTQLIREYNAEKKQATEAFYAYTLGGYSFDEGKWKARLQCHIRDKYTLSDARALAIIERVDSEYDSDDGGTRFSYLVNYSEDLAEWIKEFNKLV